MDPVSGVVISGLIGVSLQKCADRLGKEIGKVVRYRNDFEELAQSIHEYKGLLQGLDISPDHALKNWLRKFEDLLKRAEELVKEGQLVDPDASSSSSSSQRILTCFNFKTKHAIYPRIKSLLTELEKLKSKVSLLTLRMGVFQRSQGTAFENHLPRVDMIQQVPGQLVSQNDELKEVMGMLNSPSSKWVGICGEGGCGKTVMAKQVNNAAVDQKCFDIVFFVFVGGAATSKGLLDKLCGLFKCGFEERNDEWEILAGLQRVLHGKKVLLILDDVWDSQILNLFDVVVDGSKGSKILVTTRLRQLLDYKHAAICNCSGLLSEEDATRLFYNHAFGVDNDCPDSLRNYADEIIAQCKGSPLLLKIVGSAMARVGVDWHYEAHMIKDLKKYDNETVLSGMFLYSYKKLTLKEQECFLTMLSWPEDSWISTYDLVLWWRGENLIGSLSEDGWEEARQILRTLVDRSLIQSESWTQVPALNVAAIHLKSINYQIHNVILELGLNHLLKSELEPHEQGHLFLASKKHREWFLESDQTRLGGLRKITCNWDFDTEQQLALVSETLGQFEFPRLKTIKWASSQHSEQVGHLVKKNYNSLQVVDVETSIFTNMSLNFGDHRHLQTLRLAGTSRETLVEVIPPKIKCLIFECIIFPMNWKDALSNIEILELGESSRGMENSQCIELDFSNTSTKLSIFTVMCLDRVRVLGLGIMSNMRHLEFKNVDFEGGLLKWPRLETINATCKAAHDGKMLMRMLFGGAPNLTSITLRGDMSTIDDVRPPLFLPKLDSLCVFPSRATGARSIPAIVSASSVQNLRELDINGFTLSSDAQVAALHGLQNLKYLTLGEGPFPPSLFGLPRVFLQLKMLDIHGDLDKFPCIGEGSFPQLSSWTHSGDKSSIKELVIRACPGNYQLESLQELLIIATDYKVLPATVMKSPCFKTLTIHHCRELEKLVVQPRVEQDIAASSIETLAIYRCPKLTLGGIPEVFKRMEKARKLKILID